MMSYSYDVWSNMGRPSNQHWSANLADNPTYTNNRRDGWGYDANGQVTSRNSDTKLHTYDASGQETHYWEYIFHPEEPWFAETNTIDQTYDGDGQRVKRFESRQRENAGGTETESDTTYYLSSSALGGAIVIEMVPGGYGTKEHFYVGSQKIAERNTDSGYIGWRHVNPATGSWLNTYIGGGGPNVNRNELDPLGTDVGLGDPYVTVTATYSDMMGPVSLYEERGNPFDPGGGCGTLDGIPISCSEKQQRMQGGSITQEVTLTDGGVLEQPIGDFGLGMFIMFRPNELKRVSKSAFYEADPDHLRGDPLGALGDDFTTVEPQNPAQTRQPATDPQCDARIAAIFGGPGAVAATVYEPPGVNAGPGDNRYRYDHLAGQGVFHIYTDANGSDKVTGLFIPAGGRLVSGGEYDNHGDTENFFRYSYTSGPYKGVQIALVHVGGTHGGDEGGQSLGNFHGEKNAMGSIRIGNIAGLGGGGDGYNHTHVKVYLNGKLTDPRKVFCK